MNSNNRSQAKDPLLHFYQEYEYQEETGFVVFLADGTIFSFNDLLPNIIGADAKQLLHHNIRDYIPIDLDFLDQILAGETRRESIEINQRFLELYFGPMQCMDNLPKGFIIISDKTQTKDYVNDLKGTLIQFQELVNRFEVGLAILNDKHQVIEANETFYYNLGYTYEEALKLNAWDYVHDYENKGRKRELLPDTIYNFGEENLHIRKDGSTIPIKGFCSVQIINGQRVVICFYENIAKIKASSLRLEQSESMLQNFIANSLDAVLVLDSKLELLYISPNTKKVFGYSASIPKEEILNRYLPLKEKEFKAFIKANLKVKESQAEYEYTIKPKNGREKHFSVRTSTVVNIRKTIICYVRDVTKDKRYIEELKILSYTDQLTQLHNRQYMEEQLVELRRSENYPISIISADLDGLKEVNDSLGHQAGDELLRRFANILREAHRKDQEIFRIGGDEFIIVSTKTDEPSAIALVKRINRMISKHNSLPSSLLKISASIGFSTSIETTMSLSMMLALADKEMYKIKNLKKKEHL